MAAVADSLVAGLPRLATLRLARCRLTSFPGLAREHDATLRVLDISSNLVPEVGNLIAPLCRSSLQEHPRMGPIAI